MNDQRRFFNTMECNQREKGEGKRTILRFISYFWIEVFLKKVLDLSSYLTKEPASFPTFQVKGELYVNLLRYGNTIFSILYLVCFVLFCVQNLCSNDSKYHSLK